jgi:HEAT repeat protein
MLRALVEAGLDVSEFGAFSSVRASTFDYSRATPILIEWLPRIDQPQLVEAIARCLSGERGARGQGAQELMAAFRRLPVGHPGARWAIANALSTIAEPQDADELIRLVQERGNGTDRQMLCRALSRTHDPRAAAVLIELIDDDDVSGHAILELRRLGRWKGIPNADVARPKLEQLIRRPKAGAFAKKQARSALASLSQAP